MVSRVLTGMMIGAVALLAPLGAVAATVPAASPVHMAITPATGTYAVGNTVTVSIRENSGKQAVNAVQADFTYPSAQLQFLSIDGVGSGFDVEAPSAGSKGKVTIARGATKPVVGDQLVAKVTFKALQTGRAPLVFTGQAAVVSSASSQNVLTSKSGAAYLLVAGVNGETSAAPDVEATPTPKADAIQKAHATTGTGSVRSEDDYTAAATTTTSQRLLLLGTSLVLLGVLAGLMVASRHYRWFRRPLAVATVAPAAVAATVPAVASKPKAAAKTDKVAKTAKAPKVVIAAAPKVEEKAKKAVKATKAAAAPKAPKAVKVVEDKAPKAAKVPKATKTSKVTVADPASFVPVAPVRKKKTPPAAKPGTVIYPVDESKA